MSTREKIQSLIANHLTNVIKIEDDGAVRLALNPTALTDSILDALMGAPVETLIVGESVVTGSYGDAPDFSSAWVATIRAIKEGK